MLSILMVLFNRLAYTRMTLHTLKLNTDMDFELLLVDNGSVDRTSLYLKNELPSLHFDCRIIQNEKNLGLASALNQALSAARYRHVCKLDNDILVPKDWVQLYRAFLAGEGKRLGFLNPLVKEEKPNLGRMKRFEIGEFRYAIAPPIAGPCFISTKEILGEIGGFRGTRFLYGGVDQQIFHALKEKGYLVCWLENFEVIHLEHNDRDRFKRYGGWKRAIHQNLGHFGRVNEVPLTEEFEWNARDIKETYNGTN